MQSAGFSRLILIMLTQLVVENVALVDRLELDFSVGMSVITGETGAGKSIMLDALGLALGDRAETALIAGTAEKAEVHARFDVSGNDEALAWLVERDLLGDDTDCLLRRTVTRDGRSRGFINGSPATVADMKAFGNMLIDVHSQHEHQSLLKRETQRRLLDEFGGIEADALAVHRLYAHHHETRMLLDSHAANAKERSARLQLLTYQAEELEVLATTESEAADLERERQLLANAATVLQSCNEATVLCSDDDSADALARISRAIALMESVDIESLGTIVEMLGNSRIQLEEALSDIARFAAGVELDPERLDEVEARLSDLYEVARKHRIQPAEIPALKTRIDSELASLAGASEDFDQRQGQLEDIRKQYSAKAGKLSQARRKVAKALESSVTAQLARLGMEGAEFRIALHELAANEPSPNGMEDIEFLISTNVGQAPRALNRIASGGELSRISLAIQVVTADTSRVPTLVFDEVDVGIGGAVAEVVGSLLRKLAQGAQIVCVTHLPQVAAQGNHHFQATKTSRNNKVSTMITPLAEPEKVIEIARMLGGIEMTRQSIAHAQEMYDTAQGS